MHRLDVFPAEELIQQYRRVFSGKEGPSVLVHMLYELGAFIEVSDGSEDVALKNYGTRLLRILGGGEVDQATIEHMAKRLMQQPLKRQKGNE